MKLLTKSFKTEKSDNANLGYLQCIQYLAPHKLSGHNLCPNASQGCIDSCLNTSGRGQMNSVQKARLNRTLFFFQDRIKYKEQLLQEVLSFKKKCIKQNKKAAIRLNGTSDLDWQRLYPELFEIDDIQWFDYTKSKLRYEKFLDGQLQENYHLTFSYGKPEDEEFCVQVLRNGGNVAVVFHNKANKWKRFQCIDGDAHDLRFLDSRGKVVALQAKGKAKRDNTGFVV